MKDSLHDMDARISGIEHRLNKIDNTLSQFPKIVSLVNNYDTYFNELLEQLTAIDNKAKFKMASDAIFKLIKNYDIQETEYKQMQLELCEEVISKNDKNYKFNYQFTMPSVNKKIKIMKAESFRFWNVTSTGKYCWVKYGGPKYVMVNQTSQCQMDVQEHWISDQRISGHLCLKADEQLNEIGSLFHPDICKDKFKSNPNDIQIKIFNGYYVIYCYGHKIKVYGQEADCPDFVHEIPTYESFEMGGEKYEMTEEISTVNTMELVINSGITDQLGAGKMKIYGSDFKKLNQSFTGLSRLKETLKAKITTIESPIGNKVFSFFSGIGDKIAGILEEFGMVIACIALILTIIMLFPVLEIGYLIFKVFYWFIGGIITQLQRYNDRHRSSRIRRRSENRLRRYLLSE